MYTQQEISLAEHQQWFASTREDSDRILLILEIDGQPCGHVNFRIDRANNEAVWGFYLAPDSPPGAGQRLGLAATEYGFKILGVDRIWGEVLADNPRSMNFHLRHRFRFDSVLPTKEVSGLIVRNIKRYVLTRETWLAHRGQEIMAAIQSICIEGREISLSHSPYVIAELSANHNGRLETALKIIEEAKRAGADAVKLQTYRADTITLNVDRPEFQIHGGLWDGKSLYELYEEAHTPWEWHKPLFEHAHKVGITIFSSPFDTTAVDLLESLDAPAYKIASFEAIDLPLIRYVARTGKPIIISTGMADEEEIQEAVDAARGAGCRQLALLHCVSGYPAASEDYNLRTIPNMAQRFGAPVGLSDHTLDNTTAITSVAMGACIIEKHFTLDRSGGGPDDSFSLEPQQLAALCREARAAWAALGTVNYGRKASEQANVQFRRSLYFVKNLTAGETITEDAVRSVRPGLGLPPKYLPEIIGRQVKAAVIYGDPVTHDVLL